MADTEGRAPAVEMPNQEPTDEYDGRCWVCGTETTFYNRSRSLRETYRCPECKGSLRYQCQAALLVRLLSKHGATSVKSLSEEMEFQALSVYEPGVLGPFRKFFASVGDYHISDFWPDIKTGATRDGVVCQDLHALTYDDERFDVLITSDIFEHVRRPYQAFAEVARVLKPGGLHVFSIPVQAPIPQKSVFRVDVSGDEDEHLMPPRYHLGPGNSRHIVYNEFGQDTFEELAKLGLETEAVPFPNDHDGLSAVISFYSRKVL